MGSESVMLKKLCDLSARGCIENEWEENFIWDIKEKVDKGVKLSGAQMAKLEQIFERN